MTVNRPLPHDHEHAQHLTRRGVLWLGLRCDARCVFCYDARVPSRRRPWMPLDDARAALDRFRHVYRNTAVDLMGGEPTMYPDLLPVLEHARAIGLRPTLITHGLRLADPGTVRDLAAAGLHDVLLSVHGLGDSARIIHGRRDDTGALQRRALENVADTGLPARFNTTMIRENAGQLPGIARLGIDAGACVLNFIAFNPYFEWEQDGDIAFQVTHERLRSPLVEAIETCNDAGVEANVRYRPPCTLPGHETHVHTGHQLPYDSNEWDYNSWYDQGADSPPPPAWYRTAAAAQQRRHHYVQPAQCAGCALRLVCDGLHAQYAARFGTAEARPYPGPLVNDPTHFTRRQVKTCCPGEEDLSQPPSQTPQAAAAPARATQFCGAAGHRAGLAPEDLPSEPRRDDP